MQPAEMAWLCLQSLDGDCREVQQKEANRVLNVLASTKRSTNPASIAARRPEFPLAACDITRNRKKPYHRAYAANTRCPAPFGV